MQMQDERERFTLRMPKLLYDMTGTVATKKGVSLNALILQILWDWLKANTNDRTGATPPRPTS